MDEEIVGIDVNSLNSALNRGSYATANRIMDSGVQPNLLSLNNALNRGLDVTANRIMDSGVKPNLMNLNIALNWGFDATANRIMDSGVQPDIDSLYFALNSCFDATASRIVDSGVQLDVNNLNIALYRGLDVTANRIMASGVQPNMNSLNSALKGVLLEMAETVILPSLSLRNIQPDENIKEVKDFMDHQRSKGNISSLGTFLSNMTNPVNTDLITALRPVMENHFYPLENKTRARHGIR